MNRPLVAALAVCLLAGTASAEVKVHFDAGRVDLAATAAPLSEVLDRLGRQTGMKVLYEGAAPRTPVTITLRGRTPAETVLAVLEGLGVNYALIGDGTGSGASTLVIAGTAAAAPGSGRAAAAPSPRRPFVQPPAASPEPPDSAVDEVEEEAIPEEPALLNGSPGPAGADASVPPVLPPDPLALAAQGGEQPTVPPPGAGLIPQPPAAPPQPFQASPFTPQPQLVTPQPPGAPNSSPSPDQKPQQ